MLLSVIVLLFQLAKNNSIVGKSTIYFVLDTVFVSEKKIPLSVVATLRKLKNSEGNDTEFLIANAKSIGLVKNIKSLSSIVDET